MRGLSAFLPGLQDAMPIAYPFGTMDNNVAHSNGKFGFRTYPHGTQPRVGKSGPPNTARGDRVQVSNSRVKLGAGE